MNSLFIRLLVAIVNDPIKKTPDFNSSAAMKRKANGLIVAWERKNDYTSVTPFLDSVSRWLNLALG